jgi:TonB-dependent starch-binding outer membrane protein SusC
MKTKPHFFLIKTGMLLVFFSVFSLSLSAARQGAGENGESVTGDTVHTGTTNQWNKQIHVGYGTQLRNEITGSVAAVFQDQFNVGSMNDPVQLIQGKVAGLSISKPGSNPNEDFYLRVRGLNSVNFNNPPLYVINGIPSVSVGNLDPQDIESITVLKDGSASAIYGMRASLGVILINTKKGSPGSTEIGYNFYTSVELPARNAPVLNSAQWRALASEIGRGTDYGYNTNWFKNVERNALSQVHNISLSGGTEKTSYRASINYRNAEGVLITTGFSQLNGRISINQKALKDRLTLSFDLGATEREFKSGFNEAFKYAAIYNPTSPVMSDDPLNSIYGGYNQLSIFDYYNPVAILKQNINGGKSKIINMSLKASYEILRGLFVEAAYSLESSSIFTGQYLSKTDYWRGLLWNGLATVQQDNSLTRYFETAVHYNHNLSSDLQLSATGGYTYQDFVYNGLFISGSNFLADDFTLNNLGAALDFKYGKGTISSYKNSNKLASFFGRVNLNIGNLWSISASTRYEGSSRLGANAKWGLFPALSSGIDLTQVINQNFVNYFKLRVGFGITGNQPGESYLSIQKLGQSQSNAFYFYDGQWLPVYSTLSNANPDLTYERKQEFNAGFDFTMFNSRLTGSLDLYSATTRNLILFNSGLPVPPNLYGTVWSNLGKLHNSGLDLALNFAVVRNSRLSYNITLMPSWSFKNTIVSLSGSYNGTDIKYGTQDIGFPDTRIGGQSSIVRVEEGKPAGQLLAMVFKGIDQDGNPVLEDSNKNGMIDYGDLVVAGNGIPKFFLGFGNSVTYKGWDLNIFFRGVFGHDLIYSLNASNGSPVLIYNNNIVKYISDMKNQETGRYSLNYIGVISTRDIENASFISLDNMSLGYNFHFPVNSVFSKIRLYFACNRLFYLTRYKGPDPEPRYEDNYYTSFNTNVPSLIPGVDRPNTWCRTRSFTLGANIIF